MNIENVNKAIAVMERVKARGDEIFMRDWISGFVATSPREEDLHNCGTAACFAGWLASSKEWIDDGGYAGPSGCPKMQNSAGVRAVAEWLEMDKIECYDLCCTTGMSPKASPFVYPEADGKVGNIDVDQVLAVLYRLRDTGTIYIQEEAQ